jgi:hypothetical protein
MFRQLGIAFPLKEKVTLPGTFVEILKVVAVWKINESGLPGAVKARRIAGIGKTNITMPALPADGLG